MSAAAHIAGEEAVSSPAKVHTLKTNKLESLAQRMQRLKDQLRDARLEHDQRESKRAFRAMRNAGLTAVDVERLLAQVTQTQIKEASDEYSDHRAAE